jgi:hypothetical protein
LLSSTSQSALFFLLRHLGLPRTFVAFLQRCQSLLCLCWRAFNACSLRPLQLGFLSQSTPLQTRARRFRLASANFASDFASSFDHQTERAGDVRRMTRAQPSLPPSSDIVFAATLRRLPTLPYLLRGFLAFVFPVGAPFIFVAFLQCHLLLQPSPSPPHSNSGGCRCRRQGSALADFPTGALGAKSDGCGVCSSYLSTVWAPNAQFHARRESPERFDRRAPLQLEEADPRKLLQLSGGQRRHQIGGDGRRS